MAHSKQKASAAAHAQDRAQRENHLAEPPPTSRSNKEVDQGRAVAETPLHGEDRPVGQAQGKQDRPTHLEKTGNVGAPGHAVRDDRFNNHTRGGQVVPEEQSLEEEAKK